MVIIQLDSEQLNSVIENACQRAVRKVLTDQPLALHTSTDEEKPINVEQAAEFLNISEQTVYQNIKKIPHKKRFGRLYFYPSDLRVFLKGEQNA